MCVHFHACSCMYVNKKHLEAKGLRFFFLHPGCLTKPEITSMTGMSGWKVLGTHLCPCCPETESQLWIATPSFSHGPKRSRLLLLDSHVSTLPTEPCLHPYNFRYSLNALLVDFMTVCISPVNPHFLRAHADEWHLANTTTMWCVGFRQKYSIEISLPWGNSHKDTHRITNCICK